MTLCNEFRVHFQIILILWLVIFKKSICDKNYRQNRLVCDRLCLKNISLQICPTLRMVSNFIHSKWPKFTTNVQYTGCSVTYGISIQYIYTSGMHTCVDVWIVCECVWNWQKWTENSQFITETTNNKTQLKTYALCLHTPTSNTSAHSEVFVCKILLNIYLSIGAAPIINRQRRAHML